jgi:hypothetical protein
MKKPGKAEKWAARNQRLTAALRENLRRRKAQARGKAATTPPAGSRAPEAVGGMNAPDFRRNRGSDCA